MMAFIIALALTWLLSVLTSFSGIEDWINEADFEDMEDLI